MATTALTNSLKQELLFGAHCFAGAVAPTGSASSASTSVTAVSSMSGVVVGMNASGTNIAAGSVVASVDSTSSFTLSKATTGAIAGGTINLVGDSYKICLIIGTPSLTYDATLTNYGTGSGTPTSSNIGTDEVSGTGYTAGGLALTNVSPALASGVGYVTFSPDPSWPGSSFSTSAAVVYNTSKKLGGTSGRTVGVFDLGGVQTVSGGGTFTLVMPTASSSQALIRLA